ncbi:MAG: DUF5677 domain-containing protein [Thermoanaerobaculales bacterium]
MTTRSFFAANDQLHHLHVEAFKAVIRLNNTAEEAYQAGHGGPLLHGSMLSMTGDILCLHRAVWCLCDGGWAFAAPVLLRTMMDLIISAVAVVSRKDDSEFMGFKYMYGFQKAGLASRNVTHSAKEDAQVDLEKAIEHMNPDDQARARTFLGAKLGTSYWYSPEYSSPSDVLDTAVQSPHLKSLYKGLSGATHAGFAGLREFRDHPEVIHSMPRMDKAAQNRALALSTRLLLEFAVLRASVEAPSAVQQCRQLMADLADACSKYQLMPETAESVTSSLV